ncbi:zinc finger protein 518A [Dasypus novemcinctus]|uniref:zinc finger protein 518A n=1 Tax=Dasypus novemcinctus TaxID=9361 RepID=UPI000328D95E|nr:zinc finger protein 518A [Dasypus novemcinctus]XP_023444116.1 zinc finger protein 518A [Dasypus novemcinctus]XP_023444117.1 zinc finger protein 518A [Dasypus novemcinctus]XP_023444118.1 zinc finger protein 518A [Dasypus novemcinctus]XP_058154654.1 zinc finger protein 518A [Dasypus novemcinctus]XP_058154655.1 zinc finger protein 518A [Dasypus novemcinctus]XP_058154656.1 zinc finger protein 518A [Dasypus novemcinctus]
MPSEQKQLFCDEKPTALPKDYDLKNEIFDIARSIPKPSISEGSLHHELKNVKIDLPKINIPNEIFLKHEIDKYRKLFQGKLQTARKSVSIKMVNCVEECILPHKSERADEEGLKMSAKILNFSCSKCRDNTRYSPNDLQKHFQMWHYGELPSYPCEMCSFSANDFQVFKQHRRTHRSTLVKCDICNNGSVYTLLNLTKHFTSTHCVNGHFQCERCKFCTKDVGTFVQHIHRHGEIQYKCGKCHHVYFTKGELQKHLHAHSGTMPFTCQYCGYGAIRREYLVRHVITFHKEHLYAKEKLEKDKYEKRMAKTSAGLKLILKRYKIGASRKTFWIRKKVNNGSDRHIDENIKVLKKMTKTQAKSEDLSRLVKEHLNEEKADRIHYEKNNDKPIESESEKPTLFSIGQCNKAEEGSNSTSGFLKTAVQVPTVIMVQNGKLTAPANYSAKFMHFKMVDGKQHIVIKLLPTNKQNLYSPYSQSDATKDSTAHLQPQTLDTTGITTELSDTDYMKATTPFLCSPPKVSGKVSLEKEMALISQTGNKPQSVDDEKTVSSLPATLELVKTSVNLTTKVETRDNVGFWGNHITQSHSQVPAAVIKSPDKVNYTTKPNAYNSGDMHNYCINYINSELPVELSNQGSLPFHNYSKVNNSNKRRRFSGTAMYENQRESSSSKTIVQQPISESVLSLVRKESSNPDSLLASISLFNTKDGTLKTQAEMEEQCVLEKGQNIDGQNLYTNENQNLESVTGKSKWDDISSVDSPMMPRITSVFSLQSQQASEFLPPEVNQLLQDGLKTKSDVKQDSNNTPDKCLPLHCDQSFQKHEEESKIVASSKDLKVQGILPVPSGSVGINVPTSDVNLKWNGKEKQVLSVPQDLRDSEKTPRISGIGTLLKTQSDAIITQQLVKDKLRATTQNLGSLYMQTPFLNAEPKKAIFVQTPKGFFVPLHIANKTGLHVVSGRPLPVVNTQSVPASLLLNKKPGMILTINNGKLEGVSSVKSESAQACGGTMTKEPCRTPLLKVESNNNCLTPAFCSSIGSCLSMKSNSENTLPLKGSCVIQTSANSSVKAVPTPNMLSEHRGSKLNILDSVRPQNGVLPKPPLYTFLPDGKQAVFLKCVMPNKTELLKPKLVQNSTYQNIQPKKPEGTTQKILLKILNPVLNVSTTNNQSVSNSASSLQKDDIPSTQTTGEQKEPGSSRDALPFLLDDLMPANEIVITSTTTSSETPQESVCNANFPETRALRHKTSCPHEKSFNRKMASKKNFSRTKSHVRSKDSETPFASRNRKCKRKCRDNYQEPPRKKATLHRKCKEKAKPGDFHQTFGLYRPRLSKDSVRTLRIFPFSSKQLVTCPRRNQPVVVLNHPDADAPEVVNVMKTIAKFNGRVLKVLLSKKTVDALLKPICCISSETPYDEFSKRHKTFKPVNSVKERFVLKLTLKKTSKNNYQIVKTTSENVLKANKFNCWFCGRVFDNQDVWAGHGQRHLMEATRDWNTLE